MGLLNVVKIQVKHVWFNRLFFVEVWCSMTLYCLLLKIINQGDSGMASLVRNRIVFSLTSGTVFCSKQEV